MEQKKKIAGISIMVLLALVSFFGLSKPMTSVSFHKKSIESLDKKRDTVMELIAASTAASVAISATPGDVGTPIADKLADLSKYFIVVLSAIFFEKYLLTITGFAAFNVLLPIACLFGALYFLLGRQGLKAIGIKVASFAIILFLVVPVSVWMSNTIEKTYGSTVEETINAAKKAEKDASSEADKKEDKEKKSGIAGIIAEATETVSGIKEQMQAVLNQMIEAFAVMLVTSCIIPIVVLIFFIWLIKIVFGASFGSLPAPPVSGWLVPAGDKPKDKDQEINPEKE